MTLQTLFVLLALVAACCGAGNLTFPRFTPNWVALALALWFASLLLLR